MIFPDIPKPVNLSEFLLYLIHTPSDSPERIPPLAELSKTLGISTASLREQLEEARTLGAVEAKPKSGIKKMPFSFTPVVSKAVTYAATSDIRYFYQFSDLRNHIEEVYWYQAVELLTKEDLGLLKSLVVSARQKLRNNPIEIPHKEHRSLHLTIFSHIENPFVFGLLEAYWNAYEAFGLNLYSDIGYLESVWNYHEKMIEAFMCRRFCNRLSLSCRAHAPYPDAQYTGHTP